MKKRLAWLAGLCLIMSPIIALGDSAPRVELAIAGSGGSSGGVIDRFTLRFSEAMVPLGDPRATPPVTVSCQVSGTGRWVDAQTFVHEFANPLPGGLACQVRLRDQLASLRGVAITGQREFAIDTGGPSARAVLPGSYDGDIEEDQVFVVATNTPATPASVGREGYCAVDGIGERIALDVLGADVAAKLVTDLGEGDWPLRNFLETAGLPSAGAKDRNAYRQLIAVKCRRPLPPGKDMALVWASGISDAGGRTAGRDQRFDFTVRKPFTARFECSRTNPQAGCNPVEPAFVRFTADIPAQVAKAIRITLADGKVISPATPEAGKAMVSEIRFAAPLPEASKASLQLPASIRDESGRPLANAARFPLEVRFDQAPPLVKFAATFGIVEAGEGGVLPVTVRAVEPALARRVQTVGGDLLKVEASDGQIAKWLRDLDKADESDFRTETIGGEAVDVNYTGTKSLLSGKGEPVSLALPGKGKSFEVVGIPLGKPGFYVVELASPALGRALLGRNVPRYVAAGALVTNMAVHFKWGREGSLAWVTALDSGRSVSGADVRVTDSCTGTLLARGTSDSQGRVLFRTGLPAPESYADCDSVEAHPLMVSARKGGDFSFSLTAWSEGIKPYDFDLDYGYSQSDDIIHTIFDRTLIRSGDTVNMKHILRRPVIDGLALSGALTGSLRLSHSGSGTEFDVPLAIGKDGIGETSWTAPAGAPQGDYSLSVVTDDKTYYTSATLRVDEFRLPTMRATINGPDVPLIRPDTVPLDLFVGYLSGGGAAGLPVNIRTGYSLDDISPEGWDGWTFGGRPVTAGTVPLNGEGEEDPLPLPLPQTLPVTLGGNGEARTAITVSQPVDAATMMTVEMDYEDANGETLTASRRLTLLPSAVMLGIKSDGWLMRSDDLRLRLVALTPDGKPIKGQRISVELFSREILTARRRLIGGFYAYDNQARTTKLDADCSVSSDTLGLARCTLSPEVSGEVIAVATATDSNGHIARAVESLWLVGDDEWWFGGDNGDRMDVVPEAKAYKAGETARFQVRMPFRSATALVTVEREGVISSFVTELSGKDPVVEVPMPGAYAPDVYVSVMAVRGRINGFRLWLANLARDWGLPFLSREGAAPTALVDLAKPSYRIGMARIKVGWETHRLDVRVKADKAKYAVRDNASIEVAVTSPDGKPARSAEIAFAAVDEALLQLQDNDSWNLLEAMMGERPISVLTSTAQMQVVGKRHYGRKALTAGGGGGGDLAAVTRDDFRPVLLWRGRVALDAEGRARIPLALSESLSSFRLVAIAHSGADLFGTGQTVIRTAQDLQIFSGLPPLVRTGDRYGASFTLRNMSEKPMTVTATVDLMPRIAKGAPLTVTIPAGGAVPVTWSLTAPASASSLSWTIDARSADGRASDRLAVSQSVIPAIPLETWAATLVRAAGEVPVAAPAGALPGSGFVDVRLSDSLAPPLAGVRAYMSAYPYDCFEQRLSRAVALGDAGAWSALAGDLPAYLDPDGLVRYFPSAALAGSDVLTAYVLSISADAGFAIPDAPRARMIEAMKAVVDGRLRRDVAWSADDRLIRIAALAALARSGEATPAMLGSVAIAPADMPTSALVDWLSAIDRTAGANIALREAAERSLRQRLVFEGTRLELSDASDLPWWMMTSGDETAGKLLLAVMTRPGWRADVPKLMLGLAARQRRAHWDTTTANAWGTLAVRRFAGQYPATAVAGTTNISLAGQTRSQSWPTPSAPALLRLPLPLRPDRLSLAHNGGAAPWAQVSVVAAVPLSRPLFAGYRLAKRVTIVSQKYKGRLTRGDVVRVRIEVEANAERNWVVIDDPIPPGATILGGVGGQSRLLSAGSDDDMAPPTYVERGNDGWRGYFEWVPRGRLVTEYSLRLNGSGQFSLPPTRVEAMYAPSIHGALPNRPMTIGLR